MTNEDLSPEALEAWRSMLFASSQVVRALEADMSQQHDLPITWFDVLGRLRQSPDRRLRMHQLEEQSVFTRSGITRLADRLEEAGYITRERSPEDRRGVYVAITDAGIAKLEEVWPDHQQSIQKHFADKLDDRDIRAITGAAAKFRDPQPNL